VTGEGFGQTDAAGTVYGTFDVPPGTARTVHINMKADKTGEFMVHFSGMYYPGDNKDRYNPLSLTHPITVREPSKVTEPAEEVTFLDILRTEISWSVIALIFVVLVGLALLKR
jgi:hypothetical protein